MQAERAAQRLDDVRAGVVGVRRDVARDRVRMGRAEAARAAGVVDELREHLRRDFFAFYASYDPLFDWWATEPWKAADEALGELALAIRAKLVGGNGGVVVGGEPIGREALLVELEAELVAYSPEELVEIANDQYRWSERQMREASRAMGFGDDWRQALERIKAQSEPPGRQPELVVGLAREAADFVRRHDLVTVPRLAEETYRVTMMSAEQQRLAPFFLGGPSIQVAYPTADMAQPLKRMVMRGNNRHLARATALHELIPGHRLQLFAMERRAAHRRGLATPFFVEGWATYWEMALWRRGDFFDSPEGRVGTLFWRMHRCARLVLSLRFHTGQLTAPECVDLLVRWVGHERATAEAEVRRWFDADYPPLYQAAYLVGALQLLELRRELVDAGRLTEKQFHDRLLTLGAVPVELARALLLDTELDSDYKARWRWYKLRT
ncbi:hypothetical protein CDD83_5815 [Cordyceps sp. RAO-2017]|nr:hypothetical protein CDD83_5815 [Cordyceps sp. RAO-2017]